MRDTEDDVRCAQADRLLAAAIYLMSCHARNGCPRLACMVRRHFDLIGRHPDAGELVRDTCKRLAAAWENIARHDAQRASSAARAESPYEILRSIIH